MSLPGRAKRVRIYINQGDMVGHTPAHVAILEFLRNEQAAGATVFRASEGFGSSGEVHTERLVDLVGWLPIVVEWIDAPERVDRLLERVSKLVGHGFITVDETHVALYSSPRVRRVSDHLRAADVMSRKIASVAPDTPMRALVQLMRAQGHRALPVVESGAPIGIITNSDLVTRGGLSLRLELLSGLSEGEREAELARLDQNPIQAKDIMTRDPLTVRDVTPLSEVAELMVQRRRKRLPVVDEQGKLLGMISRLDLLRSVVSSFPGEQAEPRAPGLNGDLPVARVMRTDVPSVYPETKVAEVMQAVVATRLNRVLVLDRERRVLGVVTDSELLERVTPALRPSALHSLMQRLPFVHPAAEQAQLAQHAQASSARDLMSTDVTAVRADAPLREAIAPMLQGKQKLVAVVDAEARFVGAIDRADILRGLIERVG